MEWKVVVVTFTESNCSIELAGRQAVKGREREN
jgi:hypothetical protein